MSQTQKRERAGGRVVLLVVALLALLVGGAWAAAYLDAGDKVPRGTTVAGVEIGGRTQAAAARALEDGLADRLDQPITVTVGDATTEVDPADAGLSVDYVASVAEAGGQRTWDPQRLWAYYTGGDDLDAVVDVDDTALERVVRRLDNLGGTSAEDGDLVFSGTTVQVVEPVVGEEIDPDQARTALVTAYLQQAAATRPADRTADLTLREVQPDIDTADVDAALSDFANPALSAPVVLDFGRSPVRLAPQDYASVLRVRPENGALVPALRQKRLVRLLDASISDTEAPVDATVRLVGGKPKVVPAKPGVTFDPAEVTTVFGRLLTMPEGQREAAVPATVAEPDFSTADARALEVKEQVSTFTTYFPYAEYRNINLGRAAELIDGTVLKPGDTFSLNDIVGERTRENGFTEGFIISDGIFKEDLGGGVSQMATTTFNAAFFAGLKDVEHKPHSFYIDRYPVGREATVAWGAVDLRFQDDTPYGVLIDAQVVPSTPSSQGSVTVTMYSTKVWDITTTTGDRYNLTAPATRTLDTPDCYANTGYGGFDIDVVRYFRQAGSDVLDHQETFNTTYTPSDTVICEPPPTP